MTPPSTTRLQFGVWRTTDVERATQLWGDPRVMRFIGGPYSRDEIIQRLAREEANDTAYGIQYWQVFVGETFAGACGLKPHDIERREYETGFQFLPEFWGAGYATEAARAVIAHAFDALNATALFAGHHPENVASRALLTKLGFTEIGTHFFARTGLDHPFWKLTP